MKTFQDFSGSRDNNFNLIRMIAASLVLVSHAYPIALGKNAVEPLSRVLGVTLGTVSVYIFFAISGFLIAQSFDRSSRLSRFVIARILRIFPGLLFMLVVSAFVMGPLVTTLPLNEYFGSTSTLRYVLRNLTLAFPIHQLPGVFQGNPWGPELNGSLWTLVYEVTCYIGVFIVGMAGAFREKWLMGVALVFFGVLYGISQHPPAGIIVPGRAIRVTDLGLPFVFGMVFYTWRNRTPLNWPVGMALALAAFALAHTPLFHVMLILAISYWTFLLGYLPGGAIRAYNRVGDYSYGIYIYAFPLQQLAAHYLSPMTPLQNMLVAAPLTLAFAVLSWHFIEKPALAAKSYLAGKLAFG